MNIARKIMGWLFAASAVLCLWIASWLLLYISQQHYSFQAARSWIIPSALPVLAIVYFIAWWNIWKAKSSARVWGMVASATFILLSPLCILYLPQSVLGPLWVTLLIGVGGFVIFLRPQDGESIDPGLGGKQGR